MRTPLLAALTAAAVFVQDAASADTIAARYPQLATEIQNRLAALQLPPLTRLEKRQKAALTRALKPIAVDTNDLAKTLVNERLATAALDGVFKTDATISPILQSILLSAQVDVLDRTAFLTPRANALPTGPLKKKATAFAAAAGLRFAVATDANRPRAARFAFLSKALAADAAGEKVVRKGLLTAGVVVDQFEGHAGDAYLFASSATASNALAQAGPSTSGALRISGNFQSQGSGVFLQVRIDSPGVGAHDVTLGSESTFVGNSGLLPATSGTAQITTWDPDNHKVAGTLDVVFSNGTTTITMTGATFSFISLQTQ
jgi:hypothetical protein